PVGWVGSGRRAVNAPSSTVVIAPHFDTHRAHHVGSSRTVDATTIAPPRFDDTPTGHGRRGWVSSRGRGSGRPGRPRRPGARRGGRRPRARWGARARRPGG